MIQPLPPHARPDFLIIGAMKCGTSTLQAQLAAQPGIFMTTPKEPNFFSDDQHWARGPDWYGGLFAGAAPGDLKGEASTHYTKLPTYPQTIARLAAHVPAPRLIYLIRNPLDRAVSHYIHEWTQGVMGDDPIAAFAHHPEIVDYGCYGMQIAPWVERFGAQAVHLVSLEALTARPAQVLETAARFVGHDRPVRWVAEKERVNASAERIRRLPFQGLLLDNRVAETLRRTLVPQAIRDRIKRARQMPARPDLPADLVARLQDRFLRDREALARLFPGHPALSECYPFAPDAAD